jgi:hypothetical protein
LIEAYKIYKKNYEKFDKIIFYFMSDGIASYPADAINKILNEKKYIDKVEFYSIDYGLEADRTVLKKMAKMFKKGDLIDAPNAHELDESFEKINPGIYP